jgi:hypothetical protein
VNAVFQDQPLPARLVPWPRPATTTLQRCLLLALLVHVWLVVWLGSAPGGTAQPGQGVWGAINVTLRGPANDGAVLFEPPVAPSSTAPGDAQTPRWGGAVREAQPAPDSPPGAAQLGLPAERRPDAPAPVVQPTSPVEPPVPLPPLPPEAARAAMAASPERAVMPEPVVVTPTPAPTPAPAIDERSAAASPEPATRQLAPSLQRPLAPASPPLAPAGPLTPLSALPLPNLPAPSAVVAPPQRQLASPLNLPPARAAEAPLVAPVAPPALQELAVPAAPSEVPAPPLRQLQTRPTAPSRTAEPALAPTSLPQALPQLQAVPGAALPAVGTAPADADTKAGRDVATPAAVPASAPPRLNLQLTRPRGGELSRHDSRGVLPVLPRPPERDEKLARDIDKSARGDCRSAHSAMGVLAVIPLAVDAVRKDSGCKW